MHLAALLIYCVVIRYKTLYNHLCIGFWLSSFPVSYFVCITNYSSTIVNASSLTQQQEITSLLLIILKWLWESYTTWRQKSNTAFAKVMFSCLAAPRHQTVPNVKLFGPPTQPNLGPQPNFYHLQLSFIEILGDFCKIYSPTQFPSPSTVFHWNFRRLL